MIDPIGHVIGARFILAKSTQKDPTVYIYISHHGELYAMIWNSGDTVIKI